MRPVNPVDAGFLWLEKRNQPMHVAGLQLLTPPKDAPPDFARQIADRFMSFDTAVAPFNRRLVQRFGVWFWEDDDDFDIEYHFRFLSLPQPGRIRELLTLVGQLHGNLMDRNRPLWEFYLIDGIEDGRIAVYAKIHHALVDGVAANRMLQKSLSEDPNERNRVPLWAMERGKRDGASGVRKPSDAMRDLLGVAQDQLNGWPVVGREVLRSIRAAAFLSLIHI